MTNFRRHNALGLIHKLKKSALSVYGFLYWILRKLFVSVLVIQLIYFLVAPLLLLCLILGVVLILSQSNDLYIVFGDKDNNYRLKIPDEIAQAQDCDMFREWAYKNGDGAAFFTATKCPWEIQSRDIRRYNVRGVDFHIPKQYLSFISHNTAEGETERLYIDVMYPKMSPRSNCKFSKNKITITIMSSRHVCEFWEHKSLCDVAQAQYNILTSGRTSWGWGYKSYYKLIEKNSKFGTNIYRWFEIHPDQSHHVNIDNDYYIKGDPLKPEYYMFCSPEPEKTSGLGALSVFCESYLNYPDSRVLIQYEFSKQFLPEHFKVRQAVINKLNEFIIKEK